jgi:hypothetical protein
MLDGHRAARLSFHLSNTSDGVAPVRRALSYRGGVGQLDGHQASEPAHLRRGLTWAYTGNKFRSSVDATSGRIGNDAFTRRSVWQMQPCGFPGRWLRG